MTRAVEWLVGRPVELSPHLVASYPELRAARYRTGGLPLRVGGWSLGASSVAGITLWHTIWLTAEAIGDAELLLHEIRHVQQFEASASFPLRYLWESVRRGYHANRFEVDARHYAVARLTRRDASPSIQDG